MTSEDAKLVCDRLDATNAYLEAIHRDLLLGCALAATPPNTTAARAAMWAVEAARQVRILQKEQR